MALVMPIRQREGYEEAVAKLRSSVDALLAVDPADASDAELSEALVSLHRERQRLEAAQARLTAAWDARMVWADDDARSGAAWIAYRCKTPPQDAGGQVRLARRLRDLPAVEEALAAGEIGVAHARRLAQAAKRAPQVFARDEGLLLEHARTLRFTAFLRAVAYWEQLADADGVETDAIKEHESRSLHLSGTWRGRWRLDGRGDPVGGTIVHSVLSAIEQELFEADWAVAKAEKGNDVSSLDLARTPAQRRWDALVEMAQRAATAPQDGKRPRPLFTVLVDYPTLSGRVCELANGTPLTPGQLVPWLAQADIERVVFQGASRVLDVGVRQRLFTGATRRAVEVRDRHCQGFACEEPAGRCDVDHIQPYAEGGLTTQGNGRTVCPDHHPNRRRPKKQRHRPRGPDPPA
jgi:hypothetical protein